MSVADERAYSGACERNRGPILDVLSRVLPASGDVLELASGTGQHAAHFAAALPALRWQPSDRTGDGFASIRAWTRGLANVGAPIVLDVEREPWPCAQADAMFCANLTHIAPWGATLGLLRGAGAHLVPGGVLVVYGPFRIAGEPFAPSNAAFDADLRARDASWGVRALEDVVAAARERGLDLVERVAMPANNQCLVFRRIPQLAPDRPAALR